MTEQPLQLASRRVAVTGGAGFLGGYVCNALRSRGCDPFVVRSAEYDLRDRAAVRRLYADARPDIVIHLAAVVGGIGANRDNPGRFFYDNLIMGVELIEQAREVGLDKFVCLGTICAYPKFTPVPFREDDLWNGYPEETNAPYGVAKKALLVQCQAYREQYGMNAIYLLPVNLYGPRDNFDLQSSHVIPALIRKCLEAIDSGRDEIEVWGDGTATRGFLYVQDAVDGLLAVGEKSASTEPVNLGVREEISIRDLAETIAGVTGFRGSFRFDPSKPNGQPRRALDCSRAEELFGFQAPTSMRDGLQRTVDWYRQARVQEELFPAAGTSAAGTS
jgi:GDP-L-fucose synthase